MAGKRKQESLLNFFKRHKNDGEAGVNEADSGTLNENPLPDDLEVMIQTKFGFHWCSTFRGEDF
jgi:hypothetical protein